MYDKCVVADRVFDPTPGDAVEHMTACCKPATLAGPTRVNAPAATAFDPTPFDETDQLEAFCRSVAARQGRAGFADPQT